MNRVYYQLLDDHPNASDLCCLHGEPFTGIAFDTWPDGTLSDEWSCRDGERWGWFKEWHKNGQLASQFYIVANITHGVQRGWHADGRKQRIKLVQFSILVRERCWDKDGRVVKDYYVESEPAAESYLRSLEEGRKRYTALIEAEGIPPDYLHATDDDWR